MARKQAPRKLDRKTMKKTRGGAAGHEATHVVQGGSSPSPNRKVIDCEGYTYLSGQVLP